MLMRQYRLIYDQPAFGAYNMAVDEAIMNAVATGESPPTLRFYAWEPACLSLGYGQSSKDVDLERLHERGWDLVRRPTGGRAILHTDELTYSLCVPQDHPLAQGGIVESYRRISQALAFGLESIGMVGQAQRRADKIVDPGPVCFEVTSHYEIATQDGRKLIGSAQLRRKGCVLQHGSLPLVGDVARICDALLFETETEREAAKIRVREHAANLADAVGREVSWMHAANALAYGFAETFDVQLVEDTLTAGEQSDAERLADAVYGAAAFIQRR
jgi:lipoate-protein ligase A